MSFTATIQTVARSADAQFGEAYERLKRVARRELNRRSSQTLDTTALVHETYLKLASNDALAFDHPKKFFRYAAICMRHVLVNCANRRLCQKRGGGTAHIDLEDPLVESVAVSPMAALQLDAALKALERADPRAARVVELHFFSGLSLEHVAGLLGFTRRTIDRDWRFARAYLLSHVA